MGHQPQIELELSDLPRPEPSRLPERRWVPKRPGDITRPEEVPWGGMFGTIGPDTGYALRLLPLFDFDPGPLQTDRDLGIGVVAVAGARASHFGRAPVAEDVELALLVFGFLPEGLPEELVGELVGARHEWFANAAHNPEKGRRLASAVPLEVLGATPAALRERMAAGERLVSL
ncbi:MAG: hypothetical protein M3N51_07975 [Actinomycetota bacterium]|nr:hypothetical protein [Actinomycetota bacterium]